MHNIAPRLFLILAMTVSVSAVGLPAEPVTASAQAESRLYFPWVPSGSVIDDPRGFDSSGPYFGSVTVQNLENEEIILYYKATSDADNFAVLDNFHTTLIPAHGSRTITPPLLQIDASVDGTGVIIVARKFADPTVPARISGVQKQAAPQAIDVDAATSVDHKTVGGYTGVRSLGIGPVVILPIVQTNNNWNTLIRATNFEAFEDSAVINLTLRQAGTGHEQHFDAVANAGETVTFDLLDLGVPEDWVGSAVLSSTELVGAVAERVKNETSMLIMNVAQTPWQGDEEQYAPLIFRDWFDWNTGISLLNRSNNPNDVTVRFYAMNGDLVHTNTLNLPPNGMDFLYLPAGAGGSDPFVGSAVIESDFEVLGAIDEVKYLGDPAEGAGHAMSYMLEPELAMPGQWLTMPLYQKGDPDTGDGDTSGVQLFNPTNSTVEYGYSFFDQFGNWIPILQQPNPTLGPKESVTIYAMEVGQLPVGFTGSMIVGVHGGGGLAGASNNVNYEVQFDGSASFNVMVVGDADELPGPPGDFVTP